MSDRSISLVVCTHNRADLLPRCLRAAAEQTVPFDDYELLVVDNGSTDHTTHIVERFQNRYRKHHIRYFYHSAPGLSEARKRAAAEARSPILHYIDDDAVPQPDLLERIRDTFDRFPQAAVVGGRIQVTLPECLPDWFSAYFSGYYSQFNLPYAGIVRLSDVTEFPFGANISFRREALARQGFFRTSLGRMGKDASGGEELDMTYRIHVSGGQVFYNPLALVNHLITPDRIRWDFIVQSAVAAGRNWAYYNNEILRSGGTLKPDLKHWLATVKQMLQAGRQRSLPAYHEALSKNRFYGAKLLRGLQYEWTWR
jgi:glycosyltransferase involved in cell wall biosynthesis